MYFRFLVYVSRITEWLPLWKWAARAKTNLEAEITGWIHEYLTSVEWMPCILKSSRQWWSLIVMKQPALEMWWPVILWCSLHMYCLSCHGAFGNSGFMKEPVQLSHRHYCYNAFSQSIIRVIILSLKSNVNVCYKRWKCFSSKPYGTTIFECNYNSFGKYTQTCLVVVLADLHIIIECAVSLDWGLRSLIDPQNSVFLCYTKQCVNSFLQISLWPILMWSLLVSTPANNTRPWLLNYRASLFTLTPCSPAGAQPASCCQSNTDTHMPLQLTERKRSISGIYKDLYFFLLIIHMLLTISLI